MMIVWLRWITKRVKDSNRRQTMNGTEYFRKEEDSEATCIRFSDTSHFDTDDYAKLQHDLVSFVEGRQPHKLIVDLGEVTFCSTALINALLMADRRIRAKAGTMNLFGLNDYMRETLERLKLIGSIFSVCADESAARST
jgi:anti-anti-sigma regulatory factor